MPQHADDSTTALDNTPEGASRADLGDLHRRTRAVLAAWEAHRPEAEAIAKERQEAHAQIIARIDALIARHLPALEHTNVAPHDRASVAAVIDHLASARASLISAGVTHG